MPCRYDVLVIDLDGTLLSSDGQVSRRNVDAVSAARDAGMTVIIATGRSLAESQDALRAIGHDGMLIAAGGSLLCEVASGRSVQRRTMPVQIVSAIAHRLLEHGHPVLVLKDAHSTGFDYLIIGEHTLDPASQWWFERMNISTQHVATLEGDESPTHTIRVGAVADAARLAPLALHLQSEFEGQCCLQHWSAVTSTHATGSPTHLLEIFDVDVSKWRMLNELCATQGISTSRVAAIGDGLNDVDLVAGVGLGIAMANAGPEVMGVASCITEHHNEHGVAIAIDRILSGEW